MTSYPGNSPSPVQPTERVLDIWNQSVLRKPEHNNMMATSATTTGPSIREQHTWAQPSPTRRLLRLLGNAMDGPTNVHPARERFILSLISRDTNEKKIKTSLMLLLQSDWPTRKSWFFKPFCECRFVPHKIRARMQKTVQKPTSFHPAPRQQSLIDPFSFFHSTPTHPQKTKNHVLQRFTSSRSAKVTFIFVFLQTPCPRLPNATTSIQ